MSWSAIIGMVLILSLIVGGFVYFLMVAVNKEKEKDNLNGKN